jgi:hypothetical protein
MQNHFTFRTRRANPAVAFAVVALAIAGAVAPTALAQDISQSAVDSAHNFLKSRDHGSDILGFLHYTSDYHGHEFRRLTALGGGGFELVYRFHWNDEDFTDAAFVCDSRGNVDDIRIISTTAILNQPFFFANAAIQVLGNLVIEAAKDKMSPAERKVVQTMVDNADAKALLLWRMRFQRFWGG